MELLAPAGSYEKMKAAFSFGADAVYLSGKDFGLRAQSNNFEENEIAESIQYAHSIQKKVYVTINIYSRNEEIKKIEKHLIFLKKVQPDAIIISDPGIFRITKKIMPEVEIHLSTQANTTNYESVNFWKDLGVKRFILARELSVKEIREIHRETSAELEVFVHGAMCMAYSGRCLLSDYMAQRGANSGNCAQPCRWKYHLMEEKRPNEFFPVEEDSHGTYIFNSKDLNLIQYLPELYFAGIHSIKIEGRNKGLYYVAGVTRAYRQALSLLENLQSKNKNMLPKEIINEYQRQIQNAANELEYISHRYYTNGFIGIDEDNFRQNYNDSSYIRNADFLGRILEIDKEKNLALVENRGKYSIGDRLNIMDDDIENDFFIEINEILDENMKTIEFTRPNTKSWISLAPKMKIGQFIRRFLNTP